MKKQENMVLLTDELYKEITTIQSDEIIKTRTQKLESLKALKDELEILNDLKSEKKRIRDVIKITRINIFKIKVDKLKLSVELFKHRRLINNLTRLFTKKKDSYVNSNILVNDAEENNENKKR